LVLAEAEDLPIASHGQRTTFRRSHTDGMHHDAGLGGGSSSSFRIVLVVLAIGDHDDGLATGDVLLETLSGQIDGRTDSSALCADRIRVHRVQEQLGRRTVCGDGELHEGFTGEDHDAQTITAQLVDELFHGSACGFHAAGAQVFALHAVAHIDGHHKVDAFRTRKETIKATYSAAEAQTKGCRLIEGAPITVLQGPRPKASAAPGPAATSASRPADTKVDPTAQRQRDSDARRILESELSREESKLAGLKQEYKNGEPDRLGNERNYQTYLDRVSGLKASITRTESDIAAIKRELAKIAP